MLENIIYNLYDLNEILLYNFDDTEISKRSIEIENKIYSDLNLESLKILEKSIAYILNKLNAFKYENFEIAINNEEDVLIFTRIYNQLNNYINNYFITDNYKPLFVDVYDINYKNIKYIDSFGGTIYNLENQMLSNIETKYLFLLLTSPELDNLYKSKTLSNMLFINPVLDKKLFNHKVPIVEYIKNEDEIYENLNKNLQEVYNCDVTEYSLEELKNIFYYLLTNNNINKNDLLAYECYIRALFNNLDEDTLEQLNYNFNEMNIKVLNKKGEEVIRKSFRQIKNDKNNINKIKNR